MSDVTLALYDLSNGMAASFSAGILGRQIDGIWHTGIRVFGREYYFGGGICADAPGQTPYGRPVRTYPLGTTQKSEAEFLGFLQSVSGQFSMMTYDLFTNNCNNFSDACAMFLVQNHIPQYILDLPNDALNSPMGPMIRNIMQTAQGAIRDQSIGHEVQLNGQPGAPAQSASPGVAPSRKHKTVNLWKTPTIMRLAKRTAIVSKLREFCPDFKGDEGITELTDLCLSLPPGSAFPALDLLRLEGLKSQSNCQLLARSLPQMMNKFCHDSSKPSRPAFMMALRCALNCFQFPEGAGFILRNQEARDAVIAGAIDGINHEHLSVRKAGGVLALNLVGAHERNPTVVPALSMDDVALLLSALCEILQPDAKLLPMEVACYIIPTLVVLIDGDDDALQMAKAFGVSSVSRYADRSNGFDQKTEMAARVADELLRPEK